MNIAHRIELTPNAEQRVYLAKSAGTARFAYNWALGRMEAHWQNQKDKPREEREYLSELDLRKELNRIKRDDYPWMLDVSKYAPQEAIKQLGQAYRNFFAKRAKHPRRRRKFVDDRFSIGNDQVHVNGKRVRLPNIGWIKMREAIRFAGKIKTIAISRSADRWFISFNIAVDDHTHYFAQTENQGEAKVVGIDAGQRDLAVLSNGEKHTGPKALKQSLKKMRRLQRSLSRRTKGSGGYKRQKLRVAKLHRRITNIRKDFTHKLTTKIASTYNIVCVETLNIKGMMKRKSHARGMADAAPYEMKRQLRYKLQLRGGLLVEADRFYPSSQLCNHCGWRYKNLTLNERKWTCQDCGTVHDRDVNAALNLKAFAVSYTVKAPGQTSSGQLAASRQPKGETDLETIEEGRREPDE